MRTFFIVMAIMLGFAAFIYVVNGTLIDLVNHTTCSREAKTLSCHYDELSFK